MIAPTRIRISRVSFRQSDLTRAIKAALSAGLPVTRSEIDQNGKIVLCHTEGHKDDPFDEWMRQSESQPARNT